MKQGTTDHPKTHNLCAYLGIPIPMAIGYLELLWHFTAKHAPQGDIGKWSNEAIARACHYEGDADTFILEASKSDYLELSVEFRIIVHDWHDHAPAWISAKLKKDKLQFLTKTHTKIDPYDSEASKAALRGLLGASTNLTKPNLIKEGADAPDFWKLADELKIPRSLIGQQIKKHNEETVANALAKTALKKPAEAKSYFMGILEKIPVHKSGPVSAKQKLINEAYELNINGYHPDFETWEEFELRVKEARSA